MLAFVMSCSCRCVCVCVCEGYVHVVVSGSWRLEEGVEFPGAGIVNACEPPDMGAGN